MKLTIDQAISIRNDYRNLEGHKFSYSDLEKVINKIIVAPYYSEELNKFMDAYFRSDFENRDDEEELAKSFNPEAFCVFVLYHDIYSLNLYENIFEALESMGVKIDLTKYGIKTSE